MAGLKCVEHHRNLRLVGYCPMCVIVRIEKALDLAEYTLKIMGMAGERHPEKALNGILDIFEWLHRVQVSTTVNR